MAHRFYFPLLLASLFLAIVPAALAQTSDRDLYEIRIYHLVNEEQERGVDRYLEQAYLPALERAGVRKTGVFKPVEGPASEERKIYVLIPYTSAEEYLQVPQQVASDKEYLRSGSSYLNATHENPPYERIETMLLRAFEGSPQFRENKLTSDPSSRIYELRSYEGATETLLRNKIEMFEEGETEIFDRLGFNAIFYAEVVAGSRMPNLMYMTSFDDMESRDAHWERFGRDAVWQQMSKMKEYQNNVSHIDITLLRPARYSRL